MDKKKLEKIKKSILEQINAVSEEPWTEQDLDNEIEAERQAFEQLIGEKVTLEKDLDYILQRIEQRYDDVKIEDFTIEYNLGDRVKYSDISLENYPEKPDDFPEDKFWDKNIFRGQCLAGCVTGMFYGEYEPRGMSDKAKKINVVLNDDTAEFKIGVYGKNPEVVEQWKEISVGDYVEVSDMAVTEDSMENPDYDEEYEEDEETNPKYVPNGKPRFNAWFKTSQVQKISRDKYPELPTLYDLFSVKTMSEFLTVSGSERGGRYIVNGIIIKVDKMAESAKFRTIRARCLIMIGRQREPVLTTFTSSAAKVLPKTDEELLKCKLEMLGWYDLEKKTLKVDKIISQEMVSESTNQKKLVTKKKKKKEKKSDKKEDNIVEDVKEALVELTAEGIGEFNHETLQGYGLSPKYKIIDVFKTLESIKEEFGIVCTDELTNDWKFGDGSEQKEEPEPKKEKKEKKLKKKIEPKKEESKQKSDLSGKTPESASIDDLHKLQELILDTMKKFNINNPPALKTFIMASYQIDPEFYDDGYGSLIDDGILVQPNEETVEMVSVTEPEIIDEETENEMKVCDFLKKNIKSKGFEIDKLQARFESEFSEEVWDILKRLEPQDVKVDGKVYRVKEVKKDVWRLVEQ